jgi:hypothetical protein
MNKGMETQAKANLKVSGRLTLAHRKEPTMTDERDREKKAKKKWR